MAPYVQLFGVAKAHLGGQDVPFLSDKRFLLLAYMAYKADWVSRDQLAFLFWPDISTQVARKDLRHLLSRIRSMGIAELESQGEQLRWLVDTDVSQFQQALGQGDWEKAIAVYGGSLLKGITPNLVEYEEWLSQEQESLQNAYREAALNYSQELENQQRQSDAGGLLAKVFKTDPLAEDIVQAYLRTAHKSGQRTEALKAYETFKTMLQQELGMEPLESTRQLAESLKQQPATPAQNLPPTPTPAPDVRVAVITGEAPKLRNLPTQLTPFVGRDVDLSEIAGFLAEPGTRLLTLIGPGGMGKTRLALQVAQEQVKHYSDGATFVPLASIDTPDNITPAIASALGLSFSNNQSPEEQLKAHLEDREMLLVLDNLEHIIQGAGIILELLESCPKLKILTTSREALDFQGENLVEVSGMDVPGDENAEHIEVYDAVQLFVRRARRVNPRFSIDAQTRPLVARICRMLQGSPLAIELATNWVRLLSVKEVAEEIQKSLDFLSANQPDLPERHHSMRAVFEHSWSLLSPDEQNALKRLSVFQGGFRKEAAEAVCHIALRTLLTLTNKSLLQRTPTGRFEQHALVREFSEEKLRQDNQLFKEQQQQHGCYHFDFLEQRPMGGPSDQQYLKEIEEELENIRTAWNWAVENKRADQLERSTDLVVFYDRRARLEEGAKLFRRAVEALGEGEASQHAALGKACVDTAWLYLRLGWVNQARTYAEQAVELLRPSGSPILMKALNTLGSISKDTGDKEKARKYLSGALELARKHGNLRAQSNYLNNLAQLEQLSGSYDRAKELYAEVLVLQHQANNLFETAMALNNLGRLELANRDIVQADAHLKKALQIATDIGFQVIVPYLLSNLGGVAFKAKEYDRAQALCFEALLLIKDSTNSTVMATAYMTLGRTATAMGNLPEAKNYFQQSLEIVWPIRELPIVMENVVGLAELNVNLGNLDSACRLLDIAIRHPATEPWFRQDSETLLEGLQGKCNPSRYETEHPIDEQLASVLSNFLST